MRTPKPTDQRQNRSKKELGTVPDEVVPNPPPPPAGLLPATRARWDEFWASPLAWTIRQDVDLDVLERLFILRDTYARYLKRTRSRPMMKGSTGQQVAHPLIRAMPAIASEIRQIEDRIGITNRSRLSLGIHLPDPQQTHDAEPVDDDAHAATGGYQAPDDPRLYALQGGRP